ncbi:MAG TPA: UDP-N-acetylmuramate--L-alanine ligase [Burkholderiaceae bacterium]|nr:UDP-N-acetylmuramate--L-alanine ligase [Burkholderiaceae bacterium]
MKHAVKHIHFIGIGGSGMSGIAEVLLTLGYRVSGSDMASTATTRRLAKLNAVVSHGHRAQNVNGADAVVVSTAVAEDNPEVQEARTKRITIVPRAVMLAELMRLKQGIAIAGTHGKTTTTSLVASVLAAGGFDPTFVIGGRLNSAGSSARLGSGDYIVVEADESDASFLNLNPVLAVVTNIDNDHMETYGHDFSRLRQAFIDFLSRLPFYGRAILCVDDPHVREILPLVRKPLLTYGFAEDAQVRAFDAHADGTQMKFRVAREGSEAFSITLNLPGMHNVANALAAIAVGIELGVPNSAINAALAEFTGVGRRFARHGELPTPSGGHFTLIDDYGHHPAEATATLQAARGAFPNRRIVLAFQPHRYTRTRDSFEDFVRVLATADVLLLTDVYPAGEAPIVLADGRALARAIRVAGKIEPIFVESIDDLPAALLDVVRDGDVVITMGAGSIGQLASKLTGGGAE